MRKRTLFKFVVFIALIVFIIQSPKMVKKVFPEDYSGEIKKYSDEYNVDPYLVMAVIKAESNFNKDAVSHKDACGLMQLTPSTAKWLADKLKMRDFENEKIFMPDVNIKLGCYYLSYLSGLYSGDRKCMLSAYNAGNGTVDKWLLNEDYSKDGKTLDVIPYPETEQYINKIEIYEKIYRALYFEKTGA